MPAEPANYANCPRCRLSIRVRSLSVVPEHCPRCLARRRDAVEMFVSPMPFRLLTGEQRAAAEETSTT